MNKVSVLHCQTWLNFQQSEPDKLQPRCCDTFMRMSLAALCLFSFNTFKHQENMLS